MHNHDEPLESPWWVVFALVLGLAVALFMTGCKKKDLDRPAEPAAAGKCQDDVSQYYKGGLASGTRWCAYEGYWWACDLDGNTCRRDSALPAENK